MTTLSDLQQEVQDRFRNKPAWSELADSEMVKQMSAVLGSLFFETLQEIESARQDAFLTTATTRQAILAHAADRGYLPPRPKPPSGAVKITNNSATATAIIPQQFLLLDSENRSYFTEETIEIPPSGTKTVAVQHLVRDQPAYTGNDSAYQEILLADWSLVDFSVGILDDLDNQNKIVQQVANFWNSSKDDWVGQLVYDVSDHYYLRFGNGEFGQKPRATTPISLEVFTTDPTLRLMKGSKLFAGDPLLDVNSLTIPITAEVTTAIDGGLLRATTERIAEEARHWRNLGQRMVWKEDYMHVLRNQLPELNFVNVWGETEQEVSTGKVDYQNVNTVFVSAHSTVDNTGISLKVLDVLEAYPHPLGIRYQYIEAYPEGITLMVRGKLPKGTSSTQIKNDLSAFLLMHYGKNSPYRKQAFLQAECYSMLEEEGILRTKYDAQTARSFTVEMVRGPREPTQLSGFVFLEQIEFDITNF